MKGKVSLLFMLFVLVLSCKKQTTHTTPLAPVDTLSLLTSHKWYVDYIWNDVNNNNIVDTTAGEIRPGALSFKVYTFARNGNFSDSTDGKVLYGSWYFKGATKDSVYITVDTVANYFHSIQSISAGNMQTKRWGSLERWYFVKF